MVAGYDLSLGFGVWVWGFGPIASVLHPPCWCSRGSGSGNVGIITDLKLPKRLPFKLAKQSL